MKTTHRIWVGSNRRALLGCVLLLGVLASERAMAQYVRADTYEAFARANGFQVQVQGAGGVITWEYQPAEAGPLGDLDGDGLSNSEEWQGYNGTINGQPVTYSWRNTFPIAQRMGGSLLQQVDSDRDGASDLAENQAATNPLAADTDTDGMRDAWEIYLGLDPRDNGVWNPAAPLNGANADPDGDGLTNIEEIRGPDGAVPPLAAATAANPITVPALGQDDYTLPLNYDTDGDRLIDSFEYQDGHNLNPLVADDADADPDLDGLTTFREQCIHPLLAEYWVTNGFPNFGAPDPFYNTLYYSGEARRLLVISGYMNLAQYDGPGNSELAPGTVVWGHPVVQSTGGVQYDGGVLRWLNPNASTTDTAGGSLLPDGWLVEYGLNPLNQAAVTLVGAVNPSGILGDPDADGLNNYEEYLGQDGYRVDLRTGTGDETNPWIARVINRHSDHALGATFGQQSGLENHRTYQSPNVYIPNIYQGVTNVTYTTCFAPGTLPGFFDPTEFNLGRMVPVPGVPPPVHYNDETATLPGRFNPFAVAVPGIMFKDVDANGIYNTGDKLWFDADGTGTYTKPDVMLTAPPASGTIGLATTLNLPTKWPMPGTDTDNDGLSDSLEIQQDAARGKEPSSPVYSADPFIPRSAKIVSATGIPVPSPDGGRHLFSRSFTLETWVYLSDRVAGTYTGTLIDGSVNVGTITRTAYQLGLTNNIPYVSFQTSTGYRYRLLGGRALPAGQWIHLAGSFDQKNNALTLYINGLLEQSLQGVQESASSFGISNGGSVVLGKNGGGTASFQNNVWLDEVRIWGVPRSADEISSNIHSLVNPFQVAPQALYNFDQPEQNALFAYFTFDDGGLVAEDLSRRGRVSLLGYDFPADANVIGAPNLEYLFPDLAYGLDSDTLAQKYTVPVHTFKFDANRVAPVRGMVDSERGAFDSTGAGLPDAWKLNHEMNPFRTATRDHSQYLFTDPDWAADWAATDTPVADTLRDFDGDGLLTQTEYWTRTNPRKSDTDANGLADGQENFDDDGLPNILEQTKKTRPDLVDTDDDGRRDSSEVSGGSVPTDALSPRISRWMRFDGQPGSYLTMAERTAYQLTNWSVEARVLPLSLASLQDGQGMSVVRRTVEQATNGLWATTFELRVVRKGSYLTAEARYVYVDSKGKATIEAVSPTSADLVTYPARRIGTQTNASDPNPDAAFTHIAGTYDSEKGDLRVYIDGLLVAHRIITTSRPPVSGRGPSLQTRIGEGYQGYIDYMRVWKSARTPDEIDANKNANVTGTETNLVSVYMMDDGGWPVQQVNAPVVAVLSTPPVSPVAGARYIVGPAATGAFATHEGAVAVYQASSTWSFILPPNGLRLFVTSAGVDYAYALATNSWAPAANVSILRSVRYSAAPASPVEGDTWRVAGNVYLRESGLTITNTAPAKLFSEGVMLIGAASNGDFAWWNSRNEYYRYDTSLGGGAWKRWGENVHQLAAARWAVQGIVANAAALPATPNIGDIYMVIAPAAYHIWNGAAWETAEINTGDRFLNLADQSVYDWDTPVAGQNNKIADAMTDGGGIYLYLVDEGVARRSDSESWPRWGYVPTSEDRTAPQDWTHQWASAATLSGNAVLVEQATSRTDAPQYDPTDANKDHIPDEWQVLIWPDFDPAIVIYWPGDPLYDPATLPAWHPLNDPDGDGLQNWYEYLAGTNPNSDYTGENIVPDKLLDPDGDGLVNKEEQEFGTHPGRADTDDDGVNDGVEVDIGTNPVDDIEPFVLRHIRNNGSGWLEAPADVEGYDQNGGRFNLQEWTIEAMVRLDATPTTDVVLIQRSIRPDNYVTFELGIQANTSLPYVRFQTINGKQYKVIGSAPVPAGQWTMLGGRMGPSRDPGVSDTQLALFVNGARVARDTANVIPALGVQNGALIIAKNLHGEIDEVRIWRTSVPDAWVDSLTYKSMLFGRDAVIMGGLIPNSGYLLAPNVDKYIMAPNTPFTLQAWFKTTDDGVIVQRIGGVSEHDGAPLYNYQLAVEGGRITARMTALYLLRPDADNEWRQRWATHPMQGDVGIADGEWHHAALVYDGTRAALYLDLERIDDRDIQNPFNNAGVIWHLPAGEAIPGLGNFAGFLNLADRPGRVEIGTDFGLGTIDEVSLIARNLTAGELVEGHLDKVAINDETRMYYDFDFADSTQRTVSDHANDGISADLTADAEVSLDAGSNAPLTADNRDVMKSVMAAYFGMNDGGEVIQDAVTPRNWWDYTAGSAVYKPTLAEIYPVADIPANANFDPNAPPMKYPVFFPMPADSPWRLDSDGDGMPDVFEQYFGLDPNNAVPFGRPELGPWGDMDQDGLPNVYEYWAGTDPTFWDSNGDGIADTDVDSDGDGLSNDDEYVMGTHPGRTDTDDDGFADGDELNPLTNIGVTNPADSMDPIVGGSADARMNYKSLRLQQGADRFEIPRPSADLRRFNATKWTLETWFRPDTASETGSLIEYVGSSWSNGQAQSLVFYRLGVAANIPYVEMQTTQGVTKRVQLAALAAGEWAHLSAVFDPTRRTLELYRDGVAHAALEVTGDAMSGGESVDRTPGHAYIGATGLRGCLHDTRIWNVARSQAQIAEGAASLVQSNEPGLVAYFRYDDGRQGSLTSGAADGSLAESGRGAEDFAHRISSTDLETAWAYSLRGIVFDGTTPPSPRAGVGVDDQDGDGLADYWENLYFSRNIEYYETRRDVSGMIAKSRPSTTRINANEDFANGLYQLGWSIDFAPLEPVFERRLWQTPDAAFYLKSFTLSSVPTNAELRLGFSVPGAATSRRVWINGIELNLADARVQASMNTFAFPTNANIVQQTTYREIYLPTDLLMNPDGDTATPDAILKKGHNQIAIEVINDNGNTSLEYMDAQLMVDGAYYIRKSNDTATSQLDRRWWVYGQIGSLSLPPADGAGRAWSDADYGYDGDQDPDGDSLLNKFEQLVRTNPFDKDTDKDGVLDPQEDDDGDGLQNLEEQSKGSDPGLADTDDDGVNDLADRYPANSILPLTDRVLSLNGLATTYVELPRQTRFALESFTAQAWVKRTSTNGTILARETQSGLYNYALRLNAGKPELAFSPADGTGDVVLTSPSALASNMWMHVAGSFDSATGRLSLYINGLQVATKVTEKRPATNGVGPERVRAGASLNGSIEELALFSVALTQDDIQFLMGGIAFNNPAGLVSYYRFDDGTSFVSGTTGTSRKAGWTWGQVQDFAGGYDQDWKYAWYDAGTLQGGATMVADATSPVILATMDTNQDGIPDTWELANGFNPAGPSIALQDTDGDGLSNITEYRSGLDPNSRDTNKDGVSDGETDTDGDGLLDLYEQDTSGSRPDLVDTDDDGLTDWEEMTGKRLLGTWVAGQPVLSNVDTAAGNHAASDPLSSQSPYVRRSLSLNGTGYMDVSQTAKDQERQALRSWTVQAWVSPTNITSRVPVIRRAITNPYTGASGINYEMGLEPNGSGGLRLYALYQGTAGVVLANGAQSGEVLSTRQANLVPVGQWTHVAATYSEDNTRLSLYVGGQLASELPGAVAPIGLGLDQVIPYPAVLRVGQGFKGYIDDVLIFGGAASADDVLASARGEDRLSAAVLGYTTFTDANTPTYQTLSVSAASQTAHQAGKVLVRFKDGVTPSQITGGLAATLGVAEEHQFELVPVHLMRITDGKTMAQKLTQLRADESVLYAEPNYAIHLHAVPNDVLYSKQWNLKNIGQTVDTYVADAAVSTNGVVGADIDAEGAWGTRAWGGNRVRVAVIDTGVDYTHPDLWPNMWSGIGYDFGENDADPMDILDHGTHVAGIIGAVGDNAIGIAGINWHAELMAVRIFPPEPVDPTDPAQQQAYDTAFVDAALKGIDYAVSHGARVSNNSWGGYGFSQSLFDSVRMAGRHGHLFVTSAGNDKVDIDQDEQYPNSFNLPNMITVAATTALDTLAEWSNWGAVNAHLAAPGESILSTTTNGTYSVLSGTSMAAPHVTAAAALIWQQNPYLSVASVRNLILGSVDKLDALAGKVLTGGRLNIAKALNGRGALVGFFNFNDGGKTVEDYSYGQDWQNAWAHAGTLSGDAAIVKNAYYEENYDTNGDGLPDWWYVEQGLDPAGPSVAGDDWDGDGLPNIAEYLAETDPRIFDTWGSGFSDYDTLIRSSEDPSKPGSGATYGESFDDGDQMPYAWELQYPGTLDPWQYDAHLDPDGDGASNLTEYFAGTDPSSPTSTPTPAAAATASVKLEWYGNNAATTVRWLSYDTESMDGLPVATGTVSATTGNVTLAVDTGALVSGPNYMFFYADTNNNSAWDEGEPAGFPETNPAIVSWDAITDIHVKLVDQPVGYHRIFWTATAGVSRYRVTIKCPLAAGGPVIYDHTVVGRTYLHEHDMQAFDSATYNFDLDMPWLSQTQPDYTWYVYNADTNVQLATGSFKLDWTATLSAPTSLLPSGSELSLGRTELSWAHSGGLASRFSIEIKSGTNVVYSATIPAPPKNTEDGRYSWLLPSIVGDTPLVAGAYTWRVGASNPNKATVWSSYASFSVNTTTQAGGSYAISGDLWYMGRANPTNIIVQAFTSKGFGGLPVSQARIQTAGTWRIPGLLPGVYSVRAFMDVNNNGVYDYWEPVGILKDPGPYPVDFTIKTVTVGPNSTGHWIILRDVDTDNDQYSDAWEMQTNGNMSTVTANMIVTYAAFSAEAGGVAHRAGAVPLNTGLDTDGDGVPDSMEVLLGFDPNSAASKPTSASLLAITYINDNQMWIDFSLVSGLPALKYTIGVEVQYAFAVGGPWHDLPGTYVEIGPGSGPWYTTPGVNTVSVGAGTIFYRLRWYPLEP